MALTYGTIWGDFGDEKVTGDTKLHPFGTRMMLPDGRIFRYGLANGAIGAGKICQASATIAADDMDVPLASQASVGDKTISVTAAGTIAEDAYAEGYIYINDSDGEGHIYSVASNEAGTNTNTMVVTLKDGDTVAVATNSTAATTLAGLTFNPYKDFIVYPTTTSGHAVGAPTTSVGDNEYAWLQTWGPAAVLCDVAFVPGNHVRVSDNEAGSGEPLDRDGTNENDETIGVAMKTAPVTTDYGLVNLTIAP
jgi:hypothetical protein